jgi:polyisoprenoid-binding protein YceI
MESPEVITKSKWDIDPAHSEIGFKVKHLVFSTVRGSFKEFDSHIYVRGDDLRSAEIDLRINTASVSTGIEQRDAHLRSADFFDAEQFKEIIFNAGTLVPTDDEKQFVLFGDLYMKGVKKQIRLDVEFGAFIKDPWGVEKALLSISGKINRKDWGLNYNAVLEAGGVLVSEEVWIQCEVQLIKKA